MRTLTVNLLAVAMLLFGATSASAIAINMSARNATDSLSVSDTVTVDVFLDADQLGLIFLSVAVLNSNPGVLQYDGPASAALPVIYPAPATAGTTGAEPGYLLYSPGVAGMAGHPPTYLLPQQTPNWLTWPAPPPGQQQVNINYAEANIVDTFNTMVTGTNIWIASLVFHVVADITPGTQLALSLTSGGNIVQINDTALDPNTIPLSSPIQLTGVPVPEPTTAMLIGLGLFGLAVSGRRQR